MQFWNIIQFPLFLKELLMEQAWKTSHYKLALKTIVL